MDNVVKIQHRGNVGELPIGSSVVIESCDANELCLRIPGPPEPVKARVATKAQAKKRKPASRSGAGRK